MADLSITPASVLPSTGSVIKTGTWGETILAGQAVYKNSTDQKWYKAEADVAAHAALSGIALNGGAAGQPGSIQIDGKITIGATVAIGVIYVLSAAAGGICPSTDLVSTNFVSLIGIGSSATEITLGILNSGIQKA